ncbi:MAG: hypothetical protein IJX72_04965 [Clostridia bacterium]|nr:hypothetical protein [Clostridia bacterium]
MNTPNNKPLGTPDVEENVLFGAVGAFLFSLVGGVVYVVLSMVGYLSALSGLIGVVCAIKGYTFFAKKESKRGVVIAVIMAAVVIIIAWYVSFCLDMVAAYEGWYEAGEVDYVPTFFEYLPFGIYDLTVNPVYFVYLLLCLALGAVGCGSYVSQMIKRQKAIAAFQAAQAETQALADAQAAQAAAAEQNEPDAWADLNAKAEAADQDDTYSNPQA